jgi:hypothetical protein
MAIGPTTFTDLGGAVSDLFAGLGASTQAQLQAQGLQIPAEGTTISSEAELLQAQGNIAEGQEYTLAQTLAEQNAAYTAQSTNIQVAQKQRQVTQTIGAEKAATGGAGLATSGSAVDLLRSSAQQGALAGAVLRQQGLITQAGYTEQAAAYGLMASTAATTGEQNIATQEQGIAAKQVQLASATVAAGQQAETGDFIAGALKGAAAVGSLFLPNPSSSSSGSGSGSGSEVSAAATAALALV